MARTTNDTLQSDDPSSRSPHAAPTGRFVRSLMLLALLVVFAGVAVGGVIGHRPMLDMAKSIRKAPVAVRILWPEMSPEIVRKARAQGATGQITWMDPETQRDLTRIVKATVSDDPFDYESLQNAQRALMKTGWFADPVRLSRQSGGLIEVRGKWRLPFGVVRLGNEDRVVTRDGELLSLTYHPDMSRLKLVVGATLPPPTAGERWLGGDVQAGLALLEFLKPMPGYQQIYSVDVSEYQANRTLTLVTKDQTHITWGGHPREFNPGQAPGEVKMRRLAEVYTKFGRLDAGHALVDVRTEDGAYIVLKPQGVEQAMR